MNEGEFQEKIYLFLPSWKQSTCDTLSNGFHLTLDSWRGDRVKNQILTKSIPLRSQATYVRQPTFIMFDNLTTDLWVVCKSISAYEKRYEGFYKPSYKG